MRLRLDRRSFAKLKPAPTGCAICTYALWKPLRQAFYEGMPLSDGASSPADAVKAGQRRLTSCQTEFCVYCLAQSKTALSDANLENTTLSGGAAEPRACHSTSSAIDAGSGRIHEVQGLLGRAGALFVPSSPPWVIFVRTV